MNTTPYLNSARQENVIAARRASKRVLLSLVAALTADLASAEPAVANRAFDPPVVRSPSALTADTADGQAFLELNPGLEDDLAG